MIFIVFISITVIIIADFSRNEFARGRAMVTMDARTGSPGTAAPSYHLEFRAFGAGSMESRFASSSEMV